MIAKFFSLLLLAIVFTLSLAIAKDEQSTFALEDCQSGSERFASMFNRYFDSTGERILALPEDEVRRRMEGEGPGRFEIEVVATPALPQNYTFRVRRMACWMHLYDFNEALRKRNSGESAALFDSWKSCVEDFYEQNPPSLVRELVACFQSSRRQAPEVQRVLPRDVKPIPPGASTPAPRTPVPGNN